MKIQGQRAFGSVGTSILILLVAVCLVLWDVGRTFKATEQSQKNTEKMISEFEQSSLSSAKGYPASENEIVDGGVYQCDASLWEFKLGPDKKSLSTNYTAVLQQYKPLPDSKWVRVGGKRMFELNGAKVAPQFRYKAKRDGTNVTFHPIIEPPQTFL